MSDLSLFAYLVLGTTCIAVLLAFSIAAPVDFFNCSYRAEKMKLNFSWSLTTSCMIEAPSGQWIPLENFIINEPSK